MPAEEARANVIAEGQRGIALNGDVVVVAEPDEVGESKMSGDGGGLVAHAFHQIAVAAKSVNPVVENIVAIPTELLTPWPSGSVVASAPGTTPYSGCPGVLDPHCRNCLMSSSERS